MTRVVEKIKLTISGVPMTVERLEDGRFVKPKYLLEAPGQERICPECRGVPREQRGAPSSQGDMFASAEWEQAWDSFTPPEGPCATCKNKGTIRITPDEALRWKGWNTALKPAWEPIIIGRKPLAEKSIVDNIMAYGTGAMNIDATRVGSRANNPQVQGAYKGSTVGIAGAREGGKVYDQGRWPANVLMSHSEECRMVGTQKIPGASGWSSTGSKQGQSGSLVGPNSARDPKPDSFTDADGMETVEVWECAGDCPVQSMNQQASVAIDGIGGSGASRFFYCAKASRSERDAGLEDFETRPAGGMAGRRDGTLEGDPVVGKNPHPTVKPIGVMRWLSRLLTPDGGKILDPFAGSGSEGCAAVLEGFRYTGIELDADDEGMCDIARARIRYWEREGDREAEKAAIEASQLSMFDMLG